MTAGAIAAGDLSRRVEPADDRSEVGRLGLALNSMLGQIEGAFAERTASESRLRRFRRRRRARAAHAAHVDPGLRRTVPTGCEHPSRRSRQDHVAHRGGRGPDGRARRRPPPPRSTRPGSSTRTGTGRPRRLTSAAVDDLRVISPDRPVVFESNGAVVVNGDGHRLRQVVANLLENARTHTPPASPVEVRVGIAGDDALIEVEDHGPGMSADEAARAFERFWRADPSRARTSGGAGLGLAIVSAITEAHGGRTEVHTEPGAGSTFRIWIPRTGPPSNGTTPVESDEPVPDPDFDAPPRGSSRALTTRRSPERQVFRGARRGTGERAPLARGRARRGRVDGFGRSRPPARRRAARRPAGIPPSDRGY